MKKIIKSYRFPIILLLSMILGSLVGIFFPDSATYLKPFGDILSSLKANNTKKHREINQKHSNVKTEKLKKDGILKFSNQSEAKLFIRDLTDNLSKNVNEIFNELDNMINSTKDEFIPSLNKDIEKSIGSIIVKIKEKVGENIEIRIPTLKIDKNKLKLDEPLSEYEFINLIQSIASKNKVYKSSH